MNYTIVVTQVVGAATHVTLSGASTVPGVTLAFEPKEFDFFGTQEAVRMRISVAPTVNSSILPVKITVSSASGSSSSTLDFILNKALIVLADIVVANPPTLHVGVGHTVTWLDLIEPDDDGFGYANVTLDDGSAASPTMGQNDVWTQTFSKPGTYPYHWDVLGLTLSGVVIVS